MGALTFLSVLYWLLFCPLVSGEQVAFVEVFLEDHQDVLQGEVVQESLENDPVENQSKKKHDLEGDLVLLKEEALESNSNEKDPKDQNPWIGVVPVRMEECKVSNNNNQETFAASVVNKMKRALVLGASALIILALNQNTVREMDLSQVLSKPIIVIQTSENVTKLIGALLRGLHATAKITYKTFLQDSLGATLTLWSTCGRSRSGLYGEWQGVICTGETNSQVQKYLQQLWNTVVLVALVLCTGVIVHARWQVHYNQFNDDLESHLKQDILKRLSALKTRIYRQPKVRCDTTLTQQMETENCAVCLEQYNNNQESKPFWCTFNYQSHFSTMVVNGPPEISFANILPNTFVFNRKMKCIECLRVLPCLHEFHRDCVDPWLLLQQNCPLCKRSVLGNHY